MARALAPNKNPAVRLGAGGYSVRKSAGPSKRQQRRSIAPSQHGALGGGGVGRRGAKPAGRVR